MDKSAIAGRKTLASTTIRAVLFVQKKTVRRVRIAAFLAYFRPFPFEPSEHRKMQPKMPVSIQKNSIYIRKTTKLQRKNPKPDLCSI